MERLARELMSGRRRGLWAAALRSGLWLAQWPYRWGVAAKNGAFDWGIRTPAQSGVPTVSVGNLTTGGTGKTPLVAFLANWFRDSGVRVGLLSRGYRALQGRSSSALASNPTEAAENDEKRVLDQLCPGIPHWQNPDRVVSAKAAVAEGCRLLILDDAFQHRRLGRDLDLVLIDATNPWGFGYCLPRGFLREPVHNLARASLVVITRADLVSAAELTAIRTELVRQGHVATVVETAFRPTGLINAAGQRASFDELRQAGQPVIAACGIGNPEAFRESLRAQGVEVARFVVFPDHHHFGANDLEQLRREADAVRARAVLVTQKDLVKLSSLPFPELPVWAVQIGVEFLRGAAVLEHELFRIRERVSC